MLGDNGTSHTTSLGNGNDTICMTDIVFLKYPVDGITRSGMLTIEFEYSSSRCSINYLDIKYSDPELSKHVECNPRVLRNIDS